jgi:hypothetical protein
VFKFAMGLRMVAVAVAVTETGTAAVPAAVGVTA